MFLATVATTGGRSCEGRCRLFGGGMVVWWRHGCLVEAWLFGGGMAVWWRHGFLRKLFQPTLISLNLPSLPILSTHRKSTHPSNPLNPSTPTSNLLNPSTPLPTTLPLSIPPTTTPSSTPLLHNDHLRQRKVAVFFEFLFGQLARLTDSPQANEGVTEGTLG